jgi:molybdenum cofactor cytidylyltransferase
VDLRDHAVKSFPFAAVIPGAGAGTRFGGPKAVALVEPGVRFIDRVVSVATDAGADPIIAVLPPGVAAPAGSKAVVGNPAAEQILSLRQGLMQLANSVAEATLVWPVDHPFVALESVLAVLDAYKRTRAPIVVPVHDGRRGHPGLFARDTWRELMTVQHDGARGVVHAYADRVVEVEVPDRGVIRNIDRVSDLA